MLLELDLKEHVWLFGEVRAVLNYASSNTHAERVLQDITTFTILLQFLKHCDISEAIFSRVSEKYRNM
jgi:hypothetical protein